MNKTVLIGGAPTVGKSFFTRQIAEALKLPWISTDTIRDVMRKLVNPEDYKELFYFADKNILAETYLNTHTPQQIVDSQNAESEEVWTGVKAFLETDYVWKQYIVEGVAIIPKLVAKLDKTKYFIKPIFLVDENEDRIREVVYTRGLWDDAKSYPDSVKEVEVKWAMLFNEYIKSEASKYGFKYYSIIDRDSAKAELTTRIRDWLEV